VELNEDTVDGLNKKSKAMSNKWHHLAFSMFAKN
jgi:hypothetical protein